MTLEPHEDITTTGNVNYWHRLTQGSAEWHDLRRGMLTASVMNEALTPATLKLANNDKVRTLIYKMAAERVVKLPADNFVSYAMERGHLEQVEARIAYSEAYEPATECGFITNTSLGFPVGYSPDGLIGDHGLIEIKSRDAKFQMQTIVEYMADPIADQIPREFMLQVQTALWVTERPWCDFVSYSNGFNMAVIRVAPIEKYQDAITEAAKATEKAVQEAVEKYWQAFTRDGARILPVKWIDHTGEILL